MADEQKKSQNRLEKEAVVAELADKVEKSKAFVFTNYQGLTHQQIEGLKRSAKKLDAEFVVTKNTLMLIALDKFNLSDEDKKNFEQPTATLFIYNDVVEPLKELSKTIRDLKLPTVKFGLLEGKPISDQQVLKLATLPPMPVMRAQLLGQMMSPIQGLHRALSWNMQQLVLTLNAISETKTKA